MPSPWHRGDRLRLALLLLLTSGGLAATWWMAAGTGDGSAQLAWMEAAVAAVLVAAIAETLWLTAGHRAVGRRKRGLAWRVAAVTARIDRIPAAARSTAGAVCTAERMTRYHRGDCPLVWGKPVVWSSAEESRRAGRRPCGICDP
jgi:hypothetical protein